ncbi:MAG: hypothetical protein HY290_03555 [Planctomycetia bacterium]|nr:hypothetical protein [Planctomycetia bacterium]
MKRVAFCLLCAGLAALGVAVSRGQDLPKPPTEGVVDVIRFVDSGTVGEDEIVVEDARLEVTKRAEGGGDSKSDLVEIEIGSDGVLQGGGQGGFRVQVENGDVVISNEDGKIVEKHQFGTAPSGGFALVAGRGAPVIDPQTREQLEKVVAGLKDEAKRLAGEGKKEESVGKLRSIEAIEHLLHGKGYGVSGSRVIRIAGSGPQAEEFKKLYVRRDELAKQLATKADAGDEGAAKIKQELAEIEKQIAEKQKQLGGGRAAFIQGFGGGQVGPHPQGLPGMPAMSGMHGMGGVGGGGMMMRFGGGDQKSQALAQQAEALSHAAARLKEAGLGDQAKELAAQAEKLRDQARKAEKEMVARMQAQGHTGGFGGGGITMFGGPPAGDLQRSIKELQEQVQQLRKEVAEVRELLQKK